MPLRRSDRLFDIICILLAASRPVSSAVIVNELEVTCAPSSRDVAGSSRAQRRRVCAAARVRAAAIDHGPGTPALCRRLLRWSDVDLRLVRGAQR